jgi:hypothetical protein
MGKPLRPDGISDDDYLTKFCGINGINVAPASPTYKTLRDEL